MPTSKAGAVRAGRAYVELFADSSRLIRGLRTASAKLKAWGASVGAMGRQLMLASGAVLAPLAGAAKLFSSMGDEVAKMSKRTGVSVEALSELAFVATQTGTNFETLENAFRKMQRSIYDAERGSLLAVEALADLNLTFQDLKDLSPEEQFMLLADRMSGLSDDTRKVGVAMSLFGRTGTNLLPMFRAGTDGIAALREEARRLGFTIAKADATAAEDFTRSMQRLWFAVKRVAFAVGGALAKGLGGLATRLSYTLRGLREWVDRNRELFVGAMKLAAGVFAVGGALTVLGFALSGFGKALGLLAGLLVAVGAGLRALIAVGAALISPIGLVAVAVGNLVAMLMLMTDNTRSVTMLGTAFRDLGAEAAAAGRGIADALIGGDIGLAAKVMWLTLRMWWQKGINWLTVLWQDFKGTFLSLLDSFAYGGLIVWTELVHTFQTVWARGVGFLRKVWTEFTSWHQRTVERTAGWMAKAWLSLQHELGQLTNEEWYAANRSVEQQSRGRMDEIERGRQAELSDAERKLQDDLAAANARREDRLRQIVDADNASRQRREADRADAEAETARDLEAARQEWLDALKAARAARERATPPPGGEPGAGKLPIDPGDALDEVRRAVMGTFSAAALERLAAAGAADRTAKAAEETARNTKKLADASQRGQLVFAP